MNEGAPLLRIQIEQRVNLGGYEHAQVSIALSHLPFDADEAMIAQALDTSDLAIHLMRNRARAQVARIRCEDANLPTTKPVDLSAFEETTEEEFNPYDESPDEPKSVSPAPSAASVQGDARGSENASATPSKTDDGDAERLARANAKIAEDVAAQEAFDARVNALLGEDDTLTGAQAIEARQAIDSIVATTKPAPPIPTADEVEFDVMVYGVQAILPGLDAFSSQIRHKDSPEDGDGTGGQMKALNSVLSDRHITGKFRHRVCETIMDRWYEVRWGEPTNHPRSITTLYDLSMGEASICLEVLNHSQADIDAIKRNAHAREGQPALI
jgi:hypothetical protein